MSENKWTGRFPMSTIPWVTRQLPKELYPMFGFRGEEIPRKFRDQIEYMYPLEAPDGSPYPVSILMGYAEEGDPEVAFVIGDTISLDGVNVIVRDWDMRTIPSSSHFSAFLHHLVLVTLPPEGQSG